MSSELSLHGDDHDARCVRCGELAVGPCARCNEPVCGDCCVLSEGGARVYAICVACDGRSGRSLRRAWGAVLGWVTAPLLLLALAVAALAWVTGK